MCATPDKNKELPLPCDGCGKRQEIFSGVNTATDFSSWLFTKYHKNFTVVAHNMGGYDGMFLLNYLVSNNLKPSIIFSGAKIMHIYIEPLKIRIIDSCNFLPMKLANFSKVFDIPEVTKGEFPYKFLTKETLNYKGAVPSIDNYLPNQMSESKRKDFEQWYAVRVKSNFDMMSELYSYTLGDVNLLRLGVLKFSNLMREITSQDGNEIDPMIDLTLASFCMRTFKTNFLEEKWLYSFKDGSSEPVIKLGNTLTLPSGEQLNPDDPNITGKQFLETSIAFLPPDVVDDGQNFNNASIE